MSKTSSIQTVPDLLLTPGEIRQSGEPVSEGDETLAGDEVDSAGVCSPMWLVAGEPVTPMDWADVHAVFRGWFHVRTGGAVEIRLTGHGWYRASVDGSFVADGPPRFAAGHPEFEVIHLPLETGDHVLAVHVHALGVATRLVEAEAPPFLAVRILHGGLDVPVEWRCARLGAFRKTGRRLGCVLGWAEWCDTRLMPEGWELPEFDDGGWELPAGCSGHGRECTVGGAFVPSWEWKPARLGPIRHSVLPLDAVGDGLLVNMSMVHHDPPMNFLTRELSPADLPANGRWWRFELDCVRLGRPEIFADLPSGALVQIAYAEDLTHGRVSPYLKSGSGDNSCMMDTWIARGGPQTFTPLHPKGARFLEMHILADPSEIRLLRAAFIERCYYPEEPEGRFVCGDAMLDRIWDVGVRTLQSCAEDAITDNPARERGQWLGDAVGPGMDILAVAYSDWRPLVRGLRQAVQCAAPDGLLPAIFPGTREFLPSFATQWVSAILHFYRLSGDAGLLAGLYPAAVRNIKVLSGDRAPGGIKRNRKYWNFVDWGYVGAATVFCDGIEDAEMVDPALSLFYLGAMEALERWASLLGRGEDAAVWHREALALRGELRHAGGGHSSAVGFHEAVLRLKHGLYDADASRQALDFVCRHMLSCFPNDPDAPRLAGTDVENPRLITPFFMHYALPVLVEYGRMDFVLDQIRTCWGWMLGRGATTWYEVFDPRWSHCHQWSGCPTWILSRYVLGLHSRFDIAPRTFDVRVFPGSLEQATGRLPCPDGVPIDIRWERSGGTLQIEAASAAPFSVRIGDEEPLPPRTIHRMSVAPAGPAA